MNLRLEDIQHDSGVPVGYRLRIKGYLDDSWSNQLGGMRIENCVEMGKTPISILTGELVDQAELFGVLNNLYALGFTLLSVECYDNLATP